ncbi:CD226 antigen [Anolis carolinensis]|uniref:CD226 molecule n=1 Tax=Anolis carolinensis TaxID=28377 RepID=G1KLE1_ANOCA|nr:PREDICTED: CD226 antigen [Anolis carolinensis]|eukprot:XP_003219772.2 PREDICTED: CD226 antigen [Anolis carolinensis]
MWPGNRSNLHEVLTYVSLALLEMDYLAFFVAAVLLSYESCIAITVEGRHVDSTVKLGSTMTLECVYPKTATIIQVSWSKEKGKGKENIAVFKLPYDLYIESRYLFRVNVGNVTTNNKSLIFDNTTEEDIGFYLCSFQTFPHGTWEKRIQVVRSDEFSSRVFLDPHALEGSLAIELGGKITITQWHDPDIVVNRVVWEWIQIDHVDLISLCLNSAMPIYGSDYQERAKTHCANQANTTLVLWNITFSDSGIYRCSFSGGNGKDATGWTKLIVKSNDPLVSIQRIVYITGAAIILLIIISAIVRTILKHRKKEKKERKKMNAFCVAETQLSHNYGESGCHRKVNARRQQNMTTFEKTEPVYVNYND